MDESMQSTNQTKNLVENLCENISAIMQLLWKRFCIG